MNLECWSEMCCTRLAENTGQKITQKISSCVPTHKFVGRCLCKYGIYRQSERSSIGQIAFWTVLLVESPYPAFIPNSKCLFSPTGNWIQHGHYSWMFYAWKPCSLGSAAL